MATTTVSFINSYTARIFVAYQRKNPVCAQDCGQPWDVLGWIQLDPTERQTRANPTGSRWFYYRAEAVDGTIWDGDWDGDVRLEEFQKCDCLGVSSPSWRRVAFDQLDLNEFSGVTFVA